jgi:hypothetical protein
MGHRVKHDQCADKDEIHDQAPATAGAVTLLRTL